MIGIYGTLRSCDSIMGSVTITLTLEDKLSSFTVLQYDQVNYLSCTPRTSR